MPSVGSLVRALCLCVICAAAALAAPSPSPAFAEEKKPDQTCACGNLNRKHGAAAPEGERSATAVGPVDGAPATRAEIEAAMFGEDASGVASSSFTIEQHNEEMVDIQGGLFFMGTPKPTVHFPQDGEGPVRQVRVSNFSMDTFEVSNAKYKEFVDSTGYVTEAEKFGDSFTPEMWLSPAVSATIDKMVKIVPWWLPVKNASWKWPEGFDSNISTRMTHPVIHVTWNDANAYCRWRGVALPTEAQWEYAAKDGRKLKLFPWGNVMQPLMRPKKDTYRMNIWQGKFPTNNTADDGFKMTAPVDAFGPQTRTGLYNMLGNVWEWTADWWTPAHYLTEATKDTGFVDPQGPNMAELEELKEMGYVKEHEKTKKGGSYMCHKSYCYRYRSCARTKMTPDSSAHNVGFRCARHTVGPSAASNTPGATWPPPLVGTAADTGYADSAAAAAAE